MKCMTCNKEIEGQDYDGECFDCMNDSEGFLCGSCYMADFEEDNNG